MNIINILDEIEKVDGEIYERLNPRRAAMKDFFNMGKKVAIAAAPLALGSMFKKAYGQSTPSQINDVLNFALTLEYIEFNFYDTAVKTSGLIPAGGPINAITIIRNHELAHVNLLRGALGASAIAAIPASALDFTARGTFPTVFSDYLTFLKVATAFEDTGVRAYKGQATVLKGSPVLTTALQIHSVEARHASQLRQMLNAAGATGLKPWISLGAGGVSNDTGIPAVDNIYVRENTTVQAGVNIVGINGQAVTAAAAAECFDEALTKAEVLAIVAPFIR
ncbi:MAG: ferritin-like domain-containing protein [Pedobacter sp.]|nr:ferritin-like domain-containing protein [Pedobacter sp.]